MEKIVQYPLVVPPLLPQQLMTRLQAGVEHALHVSNRRPLNRARFGQLEDTLRTLLPTPRAIDRYLAQVRHHLPLLGNDEIDDTDFLVLTLLRVAFPVLFDELPRWRSELTSGFYGEPELGGVEQKRFDPGFLTDRVPDHLAPHATKLLNTLFPVLLAPEPLLFESAAPRICDLRYFDRYFAMDIPSGDIPDEDVRDAVRRAGEGKPGPLMNLLAESNADRLSLIMDKARDSTLALESDVSKLTVARTLLERLEELPQIALPFLAPTHRVLAWVAYTLNSLSDNPSTGDVLDVLRSAPSTPHRVQILQYAQHARVGQPGRWFEGASSMVAEEATQAVRQNFEQKDSAPLSGNVLWLLRHLVDAGAVKHLRQHLDQAVTLGAIKAEDIAARCVKGHRLGPRSGWFRRRHFPSKQSYRGRGPRRPAKLVRLAGTPWVGDDRLVAAA